jgi:hypothetical protein
LFGDRTFVGIAFKADAVGSGRIFDITREFRTKERLDVHIEFYATIDNVYPYKVTGQSIHNRDRKLADVTKVFNSPHEF